MPENNGKIVTLKRCIGNLPDYVRCHGIRWSVEEGNIFKDDQGGMNNHLGHDQFVPLEIIRPELGNWEAMKDIWSPPKKVTTVLE